MGSSCRAVVILVSLLAACGRRAEPEPVAPPPPPPAPVDPARNTLTATADAGGFVLVDGAHRMRLVLPSQPTIDDQTVSEGGVQAHQSQALMTGGAVDVQFGAITILDGDLPAALIDQMGAVPVQLASMAGGTLTNNARGQLAGHAAQIFDIKTSDGRRLFGWYVSVPEHARMYQLNCVGADGPEARDACARIATSLTITP